MDLQPQAMAESMAKVISVTGSPDYIVGSFMNFLADYTGFCPGNPGKLRFQNGIVYRPHFFCHMSDSNSPRCVGAISLVNTAKIYGEKVPILYLPICRYCMGHAAVRTTCNNRVKAHSLCAAEQHQILQTR